MSTSAAIEAVGAKLSAYLRAPEIDWARDGVLLRPLDREVRVNLATWRRWLSNVGPNAPGSVIDAAQAVVTQLSERVRDGGNAAITRADLVQASSNADSAEGRIGLFVLVMMWGSGTTNGRGPRYLADALADDPLDTMLDESAQHIREESPQEAYRCFRLHGVGPSFFTKWFWAVGLGAPSLSDSESGGESAERLAARTPLILDNRVKKSANALGWTFRATGSRWPDRYFQYLVATQHWARTLSSEAPTITAEHVEWLLFDRRGTLGQWLSGSAEFEHRLQ